MAQQVNSPAYTDVNRCSYIYIYAELSALALRRLLVKFKSWDVRTTWHYGKLESF